MRQRWLDWLTRPLIVSSGGASCDVIVVLGAAMLSPGQMGPALTARVAAGVSAWRAGVAPLLLVTGACEAGAMRAAALRAGVPEHAILVEDQALSTRDNAVASAALMAARGLRRALIVTQPYHLRRSVAAFRRAGVDAEPLRIANTESLRQVLREYGALAIYALRGWL